jgi:hypothetical protein
VLNDTDLSGYLDRQMPGKRRQTAGRQGGQASSLCARFLPYWPIDESDDRRISEVVARSRGLIPQPNGGALMPGGGFRFGAGRPKSGVKLALEEAEGDPLRQLEIARQCRDDEINGTCIQKCYFRRPA